MVSQGAPFQRSSLAPLRVPFSLVSISGISAWSYFTGYPRFIIIIPVPSDERRHVTVGVPLDPRSPPRGQEVFQLEPRVQPP